MQSTESERRRSWGAEAPPTVTAGISLAVVVGVVVGVLTAYGQGWLSASASSLANSAGPWSLAAFAVARFSRRIGPAALAATITLAFCEVGYAIATELRGDSNATSTIVFWLTAALLAGPALGVAGAWSTQGGVRRSVGFGVIAGVLLGEGSYGWTTVADTTDWRYWAVEMVAGGVIASTVAVRSRRFPHALAALATALLTAVVVFAAARLA